MSRPLGIFWVLVLALGLTACAKQIHTADIDTSFYRINNRSDSDPELERMIRPYREKLDAQMNEVIAQCESELVKARPNSTMGNWFADALLEEAERIYQKDIDVAMQNYGGLRIPTLRQGGITVGNIYELMPFDNKLVVLTMDAALFQRLLNRIAEKGGWPISHTLTFTMNGDKAENVKVKGEDLDPNRNYTVAIADYIANGGDNCFFLDQAQREDHDVMIRDLIIDHLKSKPEDEKLIKANDELRITTTNND